MSNAELCQTELQSAFACTQRLGPQECSCFDPFTFLSKIETDIRQSYLSTQAFVSPFDPDFCQVANERVCGFVELNHACCCQQEMEIHRTCLFETVLPNDLEQNTPPCKHSCEFSAAAAAADDDDTSRDSTVIIIAAVVAALVVIIGIGGFWIWCRHRRLPALEDTTTSQSKGNETKIETGLACNQDEITPKDLNGDMNVDAESNKSFNWFHRSKKVSDNQVDSTGFSEVKERREDLEVGNKDIQTSHSLALSLSSSSSSLSSGSSSHSHAGRSNGQTTNIPEFPPKVTPSHPSKTSLQHEGVTKATAPIIRQSSLPNNIGMQSQRTNTSRKTSHLKKKREAIENWNLDHKQGSNRSLEEYLSDNDKIKMTRPRAHHDTKKNMKHGSSSKTNSQRQERRNKGNRSSSTPKPDDFDELETERIINAQRIAKLEEQNKVLHYDLRDAVKKEELARSRFKERKRKLKPNEAQLRQERAATALRIAELERRNRRLQEKLEEKTSTFCTIEKEEKVDKRRRKKEREERRERQRLIEYYRLTNKNPPPDSQLCSTWNHKDYKRQFDSDDW